MKVDNVKSAFIEKINQKRLDLFPESPKNYVDIISDAISTSFTLIGRSDALYHDVEHTCLVTLCGLEIFAGKKILEGKLNARDWLHYTVSLLFHDIGYLKNILKGDDDQGQVINYEGQKFYLKDINTDAALTPFHIERGKLFIQQREWAECIDKDLLCELVSYTQFPVPKSVSPPAHKTRDFQLLASLISSADLIGQLADPMYDIKIPRLFYEFQETGLAQKMGYSSPGDLRRGYPEFFINHVRPHISEAMRYLNITEEGRSWISNLNYHVFSQSHKLTVDRSSISLLSNLMK